MTEGAPRVPGYTLHALLGRGGMGAVWSATHEASGAPVALKLIHRALDDRFDDEARIVASLDHPHVVRLYDHGRLDDGALAWLAMEQADGGTLAERPDPSLAWVPPLLDALAHAHARRVLHRDIKPSNVLRITDRSGRVRPLLADFGIARAGAGGGPSVGTPAYMAPECFDDGPLGPWSDLYSLGALAWEAVTGAPPHGTGAWDELAVAHRWGSLPSAPEHPAADWILSLLARDPADRPADAVAALRSFPLERPARIAPDRLARVSEAGLGLVRLRDLPFRGRRAEVDGLLEPLRAEQASSTTVLAAPAGVGKTRLAVEAGRRAAEEGLAAWAFTADTRDGLGSDSVLRLLADALSWEPGPDPAPWLARHPRARSLSATDRVDLARWLDGTPPGSAAGARDLAARALQTCTPLLVVLDDLQWGSDTLLLAEALAGAPGVHLVATVRSDLLTEPTADRVAALAPLTPVEPLADASIAASLLAALPLDPGLASALVEQSGGSPLAATSLLAGLVGRLHASPTGWTAPPHLTDEFAAPWAAALGTVEPALALAAVLGLRVDERLWRALCDDLGLEPDPGRLAALADRGLLRRRKRELAFAHEAVRRAAAAVDVAFLGRVADALARRDPAPHRLGRILVEAGRVAEAAPLLLAAAQDRRRTADYRGALALCQERERAITALPASDPQWGRGWLVEAEARLRVGAVEAADALIQRATEAAATHGWDDVAVECRLRRGMLLDRQGRSQEAEPVLLDALAAAAARGDHRLVGQARETLAQVHMRRADYAEARRYALEAHAAYQEDGQLHGVSNCLLIAGVIAIKQGDPAAARPPLEELLRVATELGIRGNQGHAHTNLGEVARLEGRLEAAEEHYAAAAAILEPTGGLHAVFPRLNTALVRLDLGRPAEAVTDLLAAGDVFAEHDRALLESTTRLALLRCFAASGDVQRWDAALARAEELLGGTDELDREVAELAERAIDSAPDAARAWRVAALAAAHFTALGRGDDARRVRARV